ncbi:MAG: glycolate oxidase iron-sulfur subunit [Solirubrobacteraceae bacterium]|nr:glycolate oxidase iron-sulfur subunit [Solirubrobacteraceae bacterium]
MSSLDITRHEREPDGAQRAWDEHHPPELDLIRDCVHCGFCLPTCPSYTVFEEEMDSPRGRILLMRVGHEEGSEISPEMVTHFDRCLGCMACVTACPSGVQYDRLIERTRPQLERHVERPWPKRALRRGVFELFTHPGRLRALAPLMALERRLGLLRRVAKLPLVQRSPLLRVMLSLAPDVPARAAVRRLPSVVHPRGVARGRVAFMQGCVQRVWFADVNAATVRVLAAEGFEVHTKAQPRCCGALTMHSGIEDEALGLARATIAAYEGYDFVVTNVAGCGSAMKDYAHMLADDAEWAGRGEAFSAKVRDVHEVLADHEPRAQRHPLALTVAYHDACHLAHAQGVRRQPRDVLRSIPGLELVEPAEWELCCGSAGIYNVMQPEAAEKLGARKAANLIATGAQVIAAANPGCTMQIAAHLDGRPIPVVHPIELLDRSLRGGPAEELLR